MPRVLIATFCAVTLRYLGGGQAAIIFRVEAAYSSRMVSKLTNSVAFSPQANYTESATAAGWKILVPTFVDRGVSRDQCSRPLWPFGFLDHSRCFFFQVSPHLSS
jgi:hypothetical protein